VLRIALIRLNRHYEETIGTRGAMIGQGFVQNLIRFERNLNGTDRGSPQGGPFCFVRHLQHCAESKAGLRGNGLLFEP
jgi:hypothetical protein